MSFPSLLSQRSDYDPNALPVAQARELIQAYLAPVRGTEILPLKQALGRVLAEDVASPLDVPGYDNSAMDGYGVRFADLAEAPVRLRVVGTARAGRPFAGTAGPGECVRVMTGAVIPAGVDTVIMQEHVSRDGDQISVKPGHRRGQNLRRAGEDIPRGSVALARGRLLRPAELGLLASLGTQEIPVRRRPRVAFFSTGDELRPAGAPLGPGQIHDSNRYSLYGMLARLGVEPLDLGLLPDDPHQLRQAFAEAAAMADAVIASGGVSVGEADFVRDILAGLGEVVFWKIAMKPGRPLAYGKLGAAHFFGLPGNPVSAMVTFYQFVRDALLALMGCDPVPALPVLQAVCVEDLRKAPGRTEFQRGILAPDPQGRWVVRPTGAQGSGMLSSMSQANCFIILPQEQGNVAAGAPVAVQLLEGLV